MKPAGSSKPDSTELGYASPEGASVSRRDMLKMAGIGGLGLLLGAAGVGGLLAKPLAAPAARSSGVADESDVIPFHHEHQAGIVTPPQDFLIFASFDVTAKSVSDVRDLFRSWTEAAALMSAGHPVGDGSKPNLPPADTGEAVGLSPSKLTFTFGVGPSLFDERFGLSGQRPEALVDLPAFAADELRPEWCGGDIGVQICANDLQVAFHAMRNLARLARGTAVLRWTQEGFQRTGPAGATQGTPRNLMGFKDGTANPDVRDKALMNQIVWAQSEDRPAWMHGGSYLVVRRIRMRVEVWDRSSLKEQEATFGRHRDNGAPIGQKQEFDAVDLEKKHPDGTPLIPETAHVRIARGEGQDPILRRSYSYSQGIDLKTGQLDAGLFFACYQRDPRKQFIPVQQRLAKQDKLNEYIVHVGSAVFACLPGVRQGGYLGEGLFG